MKIIATLLVLCLAACGGSQISYRPPPTSNVVAFMGDSETARWNLPQFDTGGQTLNFGVPGDNTAQMLARFDSVIAAAPGVVVILGGINDLFEGSTSTYSIKSMAAQAKAAGIRVILCSVTPEELLNTATTVSAVMIEEFNQQLIEIAQQNGYLYADYYDAMLTNGQFDPSLYVDGGHPNDVGYQIMWSVLEPLINEDLQ